ncbi:basic leucine zipper 23-like [Miscanthus floridulus]|uniref:basic leucine zipper 23-like n=1 Tax=Miscanthus floridulus TaxID=154761 RepID=UPI003459E09F
MDVRPPARPHTRRARSSNGRRGPGFLQPETAESPSENNNTTGNNNAASKKRPSGNCTAVRKYREKKKAHTASLEEEVVHLQALNQQLMKKVQSHAALEAEVARLRCLLVDIRGRIEGEIGT